jgi:hypothetical protein
MTRWIIIIVIIIIIIPIPVVDGLGGDDLLAQRHHHGRILLAPRCRLKTQVLRQTLVISQRIDFKSIGFES